MAATQELLKLITKNPKDLRDALSDAAVRKALKSIGVLLEDDAIRALHAPGDNARKDTGKGDTLCERTGIRHPTLVTCKLCLSAQAKQNAAKTKAKAKAASAP